MIAATPTVDLVRLAFVVAVACASIALERRRIDRHAPLLVLAAATGLVSFPLADFASRAEAFVSSGRSLLVLVAATAATYVLVARLLVRAVLLTELRTTTAALLIASLLVWIGDAGDELGILTPMVVAGLVSAALCIHQTSGTYARVDQSV